jgi:siroheme synthase-like protein
MRYGYPVILNLERKRCLVIGGGAAAEERVEGLLAAGAEVGVLAPDLTPWLKELAGIGEVRWIERHYRPGDLAGWFMAVAVDDDRSRNTELYAEAEREGVLFNALDDPSHCRFVYASVHRQGDLVVAVSTTGKCPALAVRLREWLGRELGREYAEFLGIAGRLRGVVERRLPDTARRKALWYRLVDSRALERLRQGRRGEARRQLFDLIRQEMVAPQ